MADLALYGTRLSPFVEKVTRALVWKGLAFRAVDLSRPGELKRWNPVTGKMPVLEVDGEKVYDSTFILRRLDALAPDPPLYAADPAARARQNLLEDWSDESLYWYLMGLRWAVENKAATLGQILPGWLPGIARPLLGRLVERQIGGMARGQGLARLPYAVLVAETGRVFDTLVELLAGRAFFHGERPGAADFAIFGQLRTGTSGPTPDFERLLSDRPALADFAKRLEDAAPV